MTASLEKLPLLQDDLVVDLIRQGTDQFPQVIDVARTDRDRINSGRP